MNRLAVSSLVNAAILGGAVTIMLFFPQYATYVLFAVVGWVAAGLALTWSGRTARRSTATTSPLPGDVFMGPSRASSGSLPALAPAIDFCIFCGTKYDAGERQCAACGHALPRTAAAA